MVTVADIDHHTILLGPGNIILIGGIPFEFSNCYVLDGRYLITLKIPYPSLCVHVSFWGYFKKDFWTM